MPSPIDVALAAAQEAARIAASRRHDAGTVTTKQNRDDLVSATDLASEAAIVSIIRSHFPTHVIVAEEGSAGGSDSEHRWYIDPIDGTVNFVHGHPFWCVSIAYAHGPDLAAAVIAAPLIGDLYAAERGSGATNNGQRIQVSATETVADSLLSSGFAYSIPERVANGHYWQAFLPRARGIRRDGSAALDLAFVAAGRFDGFWERPLSPWDIAAGVLLVQEAGGRTTGYSGHPVPLDRPEIVATNGRIHDEMLAIIGGVVVPPYPSPSL